MNNLKKMFIGIDIGKKGNYVAFKIMGKEVYRRIRVKNDFYGNCKIKNIIDEVCKKNNVLYDEIIVGMESTGPYWKNIRHYFEVLGFEVVLVLHEVVESIKKLEKISGKTDSVDSYAIATALEMGKYEEITEMVVKRESLKRLARYTDDLLRDQVRIKNKIWSWVAEFNPTYEKYFKKSDSATARALLKLYPSPLDIVRRDFYLVMEDLREETRLPSSKGIKLYLEECKDIKKFVIEPSEINRLEIRRYIERLEEIEKEVDEMKEKLEELASETYEEWETLSSIKSISKTQLIFVLAEIGDIRRFKTPRHLLSYAGFKIYVKGQSGDKEGQSKINKRGNIRLRKNMFLIAKTLIIHNREFRHLYCRYKTYNRKYTNTDKSMLIGVACKFLRVIFGILKNKTEYDARIVLKGCKLTECDIKRYITEFETEKSIRINIEELVYMYDITRKEVEDLIKI